MLDVAGGRGDLSWLLLNIDGINSTIADPRLPKHNSLIKSTEFLLSHPEEAMVRAVEGKPTHQPLATLLPRLIYNCIDRDGQFCLSSPYHLRMYVDDKLVKTVKRVFRNEYSEEEKMIIWDEYWHQQRRRVEPNNKVVPLIDDQNYPPQNADGDKPKQQITNSREAYETIRSLDYIAGFHPDQATEPAIDLAIFLKIPWSVVPCCVFPKEFPNRELNGDRVKNHSQLIEYLCKKHAKIRRGVLPFVDTVTAKNVVLYMLSEDYD